MATPFSAPALVPFPGLAPGINDADSAAAGCHLGGGRAQDLDLDYSVCNGLC